MALLLSLMQHSTLVLGMIYAELKYADDQIKIYFVFCAADHLLLHLFMYRYSKKCLIPALTFFEKALESPPDRSKMAFYDLSIPNYEDPTDQHFSQHDGGDVEASSSYVKRYMMPMVIKNNPSNKVYFKYVYKGYENVEHARLL